MVDVDADVALTAGAAGTPPVTPLPPATRSHTTSLDVRFVNAAGLVRDHFRVVKPVAWQQQAQPLQQLLRGGSKPPPRTPPALGSEAFQSAGFQGDGSLVELRGGGGGGGNGDGGTSAAPATSPSTLDGGSQDAVAALATSRVLSLAAAAAVLLLLLRRSRWGPCGGRGGSPWWRGDAPKGAPGPGTAPAAVPSAVASRRV